MQTTQHLKSCPVYLHPAAATSKDSIDAIQRRTGLLVIAIPKRRHAELAQKTDLAPWGGDAA